MPGTTPKAIDVDIVVVGAGPAGIAAACCAREAGAQVAVIDDNPRAGGQIWRHDSAKPVVKRAALWLARIQDHPDALIINAQVLGSLRPGVLIAESFGDSLLI